MQDPFTSRGRDLEWLLALQPAEAITATATTVDPGPAGASTTAEDADPTLRVTQAELVKLFTARTVTIVDVRETDAFAAAHIPGALSIPLDSVEQAVERLRKTGKPIVTYCS